MIIASKSASILQIVKNNKRWQIMEIININWYICFHLNTYKKESIFCFSSYAGYLSLSMGCTMANFKNIFILFIQTTFFSLLLYFEISMNYWVNNGGSSKSARADNFLHFWDKIFDTMTEEQRQIPPWVFSTYYT